MGDDSELAVASWEARHDQLLDAQAQLAFCFSEAHRSRAHHAPGVADRNARSGRVAA